MSIVAQGHFIADLAGTAIHPEERDLLLHPAVAGVIFFSRNYESPEQLRKLTTDLRSIKPSLLLMVDQEGGRVQRFVREFSILPALSEIGQTYEKDPHLACQRSREMGYLMAKELRACGIDFSLAPVLDLAKKESRVIGSRGFDSDPQIVSALGEFYIEGMNAAQMPATGKHFPGHGSVVEDSHVDLPKDSRSFAQIESEDLIPFIKLLPKLDAIMPAHVIYTQVDAKYPASLSTFWLTDYLREQLKFKGLIISDDLSMKAADAFGDFSTRVLRALSAGCNLVLCCNQSTATQYSIVKTIEEYHGITTTNS